MSGLGAIYRRELAGLFVTPVGWLLMFFALGVHFLHLVAALAQTGGDVNLTLQVVMGIGGLFWVLAVLLPPLLTMRMISEEARSGLLEFLLTAPVGDAAVVTGKALAASTFMAILWSTGPLFGLVFQILGASPDWGLVILLWLGAVLVSTLFCALGVVASALSNSPILAAFLALIFELVLFLVQTFAGFAPPSWESVLERGLPLIDILTQVETSFLRGAFDSASILFFVVWTTVALFTATRILEARRWL